MSSAARTRPRAHHDVLLFWSIFVSPRVSLVGIVLRFYSLLSSLHWFRCQFRKIRTSGKRRRRRPSQRRRVRIQCHSHKPNTYSDYYNKPFVICSTRFVTLWDTTRSSRHAESALHSVPIISYHDPRTRITPEQLTPSRLRSPLTRTLCASPHRIHSATSESPVIVEACSVVLVLTFRRHSFSHTESGPGSKFP